MCCEFLVFCFLCFLLKFLFLLFNLWGKLGGGGGVRERVWVSVEFVCNFVKFNFVVWWLCSWFVMLFCRFSEFFSVWYVLGDVEDIYIGDVFEYLLVVW